MPAARLLTLVGVCVALAGCRGPGRRPANRRPAPNDAGVWEITGDHDAAWRRQACRDAYEHAGAMLDEDPRDEAAARSYRAQAETRQDECRARMTETIYRCVMSARDFAAVLRCDQP